MFNLTLAFFLLLFLSVQSQNGLNVTTGGYDSSASVKYANSYCASHSEWLCAEFVARSLNAGGLFSGVTDYGSLRLIIFSLYIYII